MICEICMNDLTLCTDADRKRLEDEKWEQRRYEIARDILPALYTVMSADVGQQTTINYAIDYAEEMVKKLRETKDDPSA